jgi:hypothetical protein
MIVSAGQSELPPSLMQLNLSSAHLAGNIAVSWLPKIKAIFVPQFGDARDRRRLKKTKEIASIYCTFTALCCKSLIISGAGEGNRTLVSIIRTSNSASVYHDLYANFSNCSTACWKNVSSN